MTPDMKELPAELGALAGKLTKAQRRAIRDSFVSSWGDVYVPTATRWDVRRRLVERGLCSKRTGMPLRKRGLALRAHLQSNPIPDLDSKEVGR